MPRHVRFRAGLVLSLALALILTATMGGPRPHAQHAPLLTYADYGNQAMTNLLKDFYTKGKWKGCMSGCAASNQDWGADAMTFTLFLRWKSHPHDARVESSLTTLAQTAPHYPSPCQSARGCGQWSDVPMWDSLALGREYEVTGRKQASILLKEEAAFNMVDRAGSSVYAFGACPAIHYQQPGGRRNQLKTLETDSNYIKAALLLYRSTQKGSYLSKARAEYAAVRRYFLDPHLPLYSVYVFDDGRTCRQVHGRFFASVNGNMIDNGLLLARATGDLSYRDQAIVTAQAVASFLAKAREMR